jgi:hypothetical protein
MNWLRRLWPRRILVFCDYLADPVWTYPGRVGVQLEALPLSDGTRDALRRWAARYDALLGSDFEWSEPADAEAFEREGERLWRVVQDELGPRWKVGYLSDAQDRVLW